MKDGLKLSTLWRIRKWSEENWKRDIDHFGIILPEDHRKLHLLEQPTMIVGNLALNVGINVLWDLVGGTSTARYDHDHAELGVGDDDTAAGATQTDLQAATNKLWVAMDTSYPTYGTDQKITWKSTFGSSDANYAWKEMAVRNATPVLLNRKVSNQGTKTSGQVWELTLVITGS